VSNDPPGWRRHLIDATIFGSRQLLIMSPQIPDANLIDIMEENDLKPITIAPYHGELVIIEDMVTFTGHFCYKVKQDQDKAAK
jgi:hypothetical protein